MKKTIISFIAILMALCLIASLVLLIIGNYEFGIVAIIVSAILIAVIVMMGKQQVKINHSEQIEFKTNAHQIKVSLENYTIKSNSWIDEVVINNGRTGALNQIMGNPDKNIQKIKRNINVITFKFPIQGELTEHVIYVEKEPKAIEMLLAMHPETILYVDKNDPKKIYLDLEFLNIVQVNGI